MEICYISKRNSIQIYTVNISLLCSQQSLKLFMMDDYELEVVLQLYSRSMYFSYVCAFLMEKVNITVQLLTWKIHLSPLVTYVQIFQLQI